ncbi:AraC family transcriptional regulator [Ruania alba]|uniref:AraC-type DNA-binding protein n=1 Tax=Ruania alba TaxID=648782 RepID=A0A1H5L970_9MICO|nr:AraC family transcriptional regulator [Ruania alba]SEE73573.1 AraC-type DNA-binding protein [Ruania alba]
MSPQRLHDAHVANVTVTDIGSWQDIVSWHFHPIRCRTEAPGFSASISRYRISPSLTISRLRVGPHHAERVSGTQVDDVLMAVTLDGAWSLHQHGRTASLGPGSIVLWNARVPYSIEAPSAPQDLLLAQLARPIAGLGDGFLDHLMVTPIGADAPGQPSLQAMLLSLQTDQFLDDPIAGASMTSAVGQVLGSVARSALTHERPADPVRAEKLNLLRASLRERLSDTQLTVEDLAAQHFISARYVHALFADDADTPAAYLRRIRMEHACRLLLERPGMTIQSVARQSGYSDAPSFIRAFTRTFGISPTRWTRVRSEVRHHDDAAGCAPVGLSAEAGWGLQAGHRSRRRAGTGG